MSLTIQQIAELVQGTVHGDGNVVIRAARPLKDAQAGDITFADAHHAFKLAECRASAAIVAHALTGIGMPLIQVLDPLEAFVTIVRHLKGETASGQVAETARGIHPSAFVHPTANIGPGSSIGPFASIGEGASMGARCRIYSGVVVGSRCRLGDDVTLYPNVVLYDDCILGHRAIVHANAVLGADGFGYRFQGGKHVKMPQLGHVEIGDDVEIGACTTIDRGTFEATRISEGTKIDNLVQVGHNCHVGKHNLFVSQVAIAGSCSTGDHVVIAGQVGICDHVHIGSGAMVGAKAGVTKDVPAGQRMLGAPAMPEREQKRILMTLEKLPEMRRELRRIMQHLGLNEDKAA